MAEPARAEPPGNWSIAVERLFGVSRAWARGTGAGNEADETSVSLFTQYEDHRGYSAPRVAFDYIFDLGVSVGGAFGFGKYNGDFEYDDYRINAGLLAARLGFLLTPAPSVSVWPRAGIVLATSDNGKASALTLEVPVLFVLPKHVVGVAVTPYVEYGVRIEAPFLDDYSVYEKISELGLSIGGNVFF